ncbi:MAG: hypothetical protein GZ094_21240 [Mariniphaga sp.]|nr:hypothetical protein [Mariniphaga sp.]
MNKTLLLFATLLLFSCTSNKFVKIDQYQVIITDFQWYGDPQKWGSMTGDFQGLDVELYNSLKGKSGVFTIQLVNNIHDKYGNINPESKSIGTINADELSKYQSMSFWRQESGGTLDIFANYIGMK